MAADLVAYQRLDEELLKLVDAFTNLVKAARATDDEGDGGGGKDGGRGERRAPGELTEVLAEKMLLSGHACVHIVGELKKGAMLSDFTTLIDGVRGLRGALERTAAAAQAELGALRRDVQGLLNRLEAHYYGSAPAERGRLPDNPAGAQLAQLCELAMRASGGSGGGVAAAGAVAGGSGGAQPGHHHHGRGHL